MKDIQIIEGKFEVVESDNYHIEEIMKDREGEDMYRPLVGVGIEGLKKTDASLFEIRKIIELNLSRDVFSKKTVEVTKKEIKIY